MTIFLPVLDFFYSSLPSFPPLVFVPNPRRRLPLGVDLPYSATLANVPDVFTPFKSAVEAKCRVRPQILEPRPRQTAASWLCWGWLCWGWLCHPSDVFFLDLWALFFGPHLGVVGGGDLV